MRLLDLPQRTPRGSNDGLHRAARAVAALVVLLLCGCHVCHYDKVREGEFHGNLRVVWVSADEFIYVPDPSCDFYFVRHDGTTIRPKLMWTDGGSIPRFLWDHRAYSPWGYGPAYIIHDWLFTAHKIEDPDDGHYSFEETAMIMSEATKTLMLTRGSDGRAKVPLDKQAMYVQYLAVKSAIARDLWDQPPTDPPDNICPGTLRDIRELVDRWPHLVPTQMQHLLHSEVNAVESPTTKRMPATARSTTKWD